MEKQGNNFFKNLLAKVVAFFKTVGAKTAAFVKKAAPKVAAFFKALPGKVAAWFQSLNKQKLDKALDIFLWIFLAFSLVMTVFAFSAQASGNGNPTFGGKMMFFVKSDSMDGPEGFKKGDMIISRVLSEEDKLQLKEGDVITFFADLNLDDGLDNKELNTHRIETVFCDESGKIISLITKGDNKAVNDLTPVALSEVVALWTGARVPVLGAILGFLQSRLGFGICVVIPLLLFFVYKLVMMVKAIAALKKEDKRPITAEEEEEIKRRAVEEYLAKQAAEQQKKNEDSSSDDSTKSE